MSSIDSNSIQRFSQLLLNIYRLAQTASGLDFQDAALEQIKNFIPFDKAIWGTATMTEHGIDLHTLHQYRTVPGMMEEYDKLKHFDTAAMELARHPKQTKAWHWYDFADEGFCQFLHRVEHRSNCLSSVADLRTGFMAWFSLYRTDESHEYSDTELTMVSELTEHLMQALAINRVVRMERIVNDIHRERWSVAICDIKGVIYHADHSFLEKAKSALSLDDKFVFPNEIVSRFAEGSFEFIPNNIVVNGSVEKDLVFLKVRDKHPIDTLSNREFVVAKLMAEGQSLKDAAVALQRSPETVRTQMRSVFQKLNINKISQLPGLLAMRSG